MVIFFGMNEAAEGDSPQVDNQGRQLWVQDGRGILEKNVDRKMVLSLK